MHYEVAGMLLGLMLVSGLCNAASIPAEDRSGGADAAGLATFGTSAKEVRVLGGGKEAELFAHDGRGCLMHMWFGGDWPRWDRTRIRCYVDGEMAASIDMELFLGHGIGFGDAAAPWGTERIGKTGHPSGIFNTYRIPFGKSIRVTAQATQAALTPPACADLKGDPPFWWIIRGVENMPVELGGIRLPDDGKPRADLLRKDGLHLNDEGYKAWTKILRPILTEK